MNIVVTGASRGIGFQLALHLAKEHDSKIFALSRNTKGLGELLKSEHAGKITVIPCDLINEHSLKDAIRIIEKEVDSLELVICNAGLLIKKDFENLSMQDWKNVYDVNVFGTVNMIRLLMPLLRKGMISPDQKVRSHVVTISSMGGMQGSIKFGGLSAYSSSKAALQGINECLATEFDKEGIRFNTVALGSVETEMFREAFPGLKASADPSEAAGWLAQFALNGWKFFNGKTIPFSDSTP